MTATDLRRLDCRGETREVSVAGSEATVGGSRVPFREVRRDGALVALEVAGVLVPVRVERREGRAFVWCRGEAFEVSVAAPAAGRPRSAGAEHSGGQVVAPMPGRIRRILVRAGETVVKGQVVLVLEAMKMEHAIRAPRDGVVSRLDRAEGDLVDAGAVLAEFADAPSGGAG